MKIVAFPELNNRVTAPQGSSPLEQVAAVEFEWRRGEIPPRHATTVNEVVSLRCAKKRQMRWTDKGAPLLLQARVAVLNDALKMREKPAVLATLLRQCLESVRLTPDDRNTPTGWRLQGSARSG
jgi:hypothetical protein